MPKSAIWVGLSGLVVVLVGWGVWASLPDSAEKLTASDKFPPPDAPQPKATVVGGTEYNFGIMQAGETLDHTFVIRNDGEAPLRLEKGETSCKCTLSELSDGYVQPGEEVEIHLSWEAKDETPSFRQTARILTNDRTAGNVGDDEELQGVIEFAIFGRIQQLIQARPEERLIATQLPAGKEHQLEFIVYSPAVDLFKITGVELLNPEIAEYFEVSHSPTSVEEPDSGLSLAGHQFTVRLKPGLPLGRFSQTLGISTDIPNTSRFEYPIKGSIAGDLQILSSEWNNEVGMLMVGQVRSSQGTKRHFSLSASGEHKAIEITKIEVSPPDVLKVSHDEPNDFGKARVFRFTLEIPPGTTPASYFGSGENGYGEVTIHTTHPDTPTLKMLIKFAVVDG